MANQHVVSRPEGWGVRGEGNSRDSGHFRTQAQAEDRAKEIAQNQGGDVIIHGENGRIRERNTYGKPDYCPPKG